MRALWFALPPLLLASAARADLLDSLPGNWGTSNPNSSCAARYYAVTVDGGQIVFSRGGAVEDREMVVESGESQITTTTVVSRSGERPGTRWLYTRYNDDRIYVSNSSGKGFYIFRCSKRSLGAAPPTAAPDLPKQ